MGILQGSWKYRIAVFFITIPSVLYRYGKPGNTEQETSPRPLYWNYNFNYNVTCSISAHVQTLNKYLDPESTLKYKAKYKELYLCY